jgi:hypothetical protein
MDLTDINRIFHPTAAEYTFSAAHGTDFKTLHILDHKASPDKYKKKEVISYNSSDINGIKPAINSSRNYTNTGD